MITVDSDKVYWHRYIDWYEKNCFQLLEPKNILEFGVLHGESIRYLNRRFPLANIVGVDRDPKEASWPVSDRVSYVQLDQGVREKVKKLLRTTNFDLIIDDGSHDPKHQAICLTEGLLNLSTSGYYIVEDLHTNLGITGSPLHVLLVLEREKKLGNFATESLLKKLSTSFFTIDEIRFLFYNIQEIDLYKRILLPLKCWKCKQYEFDYALLNCSCGEPLLAENDSISAILKKV